MQNAETGCSGDVTGAEIQHNFKKMHSSRGRRWLYGAAAALAAFALSATQALAVYKVSAAFPGSGITTSVPASSHTTLQITLSSDVGDLAPLPGAGFTLNLPAGLRVFTTPGVVNTCGGTVTAASNATTITVSGATVPAAAASCTISVEVYNTPNSLNGSCATPAPNFTITPSSFTAVVPAQLTVNALTSACVTVGTFPALESPADRQGSNLNCTANDVSVGQINIAGTTQCVFGQPVTLNLTANITTTATSRYDIGIFFSGDGRDLQVLSANGGAAFASELILDHPDGLVSNLDNDACLDTSSGVQTGYVLGLITITCTPNPTTGKLDLVSLVTWNQSSSPTDCGGPQDITVGTKSKCTTGTTATPVDVLGQINIKKTTSPSPDPNGTTFNFTAPNTQVFNGTTFVPTPSPFGLMDTQTQQLVTQPLTQGGTVYVITETPNPDYTLSNIFCTDPAGLPTPGQGTAPAYATVNIANGTVTTTMSTANGQLDCTFVNTLNPLTVTVTKSWVTAVTGDTAALSITGSGASSIVPGSSTAPSTTTNATAVVTQGSTVNVAEVLGAGNLGSYTSGLACVSNGQPVTVVGGSFTMPAHSVVCTFTNTGATAGITLTKAWSNAVIGDTTTLAISGAQVSGAVGGNSTAPSTTTPATATAVSGSTVTLAETLGASNGGVYTASLACVSNGNPVPVTNNTIVAPTTPTTCTFTNTGAAGGVSLTKVWVNAVIGDTATMSISGTQVSNIVAGNSTAPNTTSPATASAVAGSTVNIAEALGGANHGAYTTTVACTTNAGATIVPVTSGSFTMPATPVSCTFTNTGTTNTVTLTKSWVTAVIGDTATLTISGAQLSGVVGGNSTAPATTNNASATAVSGSTVTVSELLGGGNLGSYTTGLACVSNGSPVVVTSGSFTMPATAVTCTFTNTGATNTVSLTKVWSNAVIGDSTSLTIGGAQVSNVTAGFSTAPSTTTAATATAVSGSTVSVSELLAVGNKGSYATLLACTTNGAPVVVTSGNFAMPTTPVVCTFTNTGATAAISLTKVWVNAVTGDTTTLAISGTQVSGATGGNSTAPATTTDATATAISGSTVNLAETLGGANRGTYTTSVSCVSNGAPVVVTSNSFTAPTTPVACTFTNTGSTTSVTLTKAWVNAVIGDTTTLTITGPQVSGAVGGNSTAPSTTTNATATAVAGSTVTFAELLGGANHGTYTTALSCVSNGSPVTVTNNTITAPGAAVTCTFTNTGSTGAVTLTKVWTNSIAGDTVTLTISGTQVTGATGGNSTAPSTTTAATGTAVTGSTVNVAEALGGANVGVYVPSLVCTSNGAPVTVTSGNFTMPGAAVTCTFTNAGTNAGVTLTKVWNNSVTGDTATLTISGSGVSGATGGNSTAPSTTTPATAQANTGSTVNLAETLGAGNLGVYTTTVGCTTNGAPVTVTNNTFTMPATPVICTFTNTQAATTVTLTKAFTGGTTGNAVSLTITGGTGAAATPGNATVGGATTAASAGVKPGDTVTLTEGFTSGLASNYNSTLVCTNGSGVFTYTPGALAGTLSIVGADVGKTIACTFTNAAKPTLTKVFSPTTFQAGGATTLIFTITNPAANNPAQVVSFTDNLPSGLQVAGTPAVLNNCSGGTVTAAAGSTSITVSGVTVGASTATATTCSIQVNVTNVPGQVNASCSGNPPAFTNSATNVSNLTNLLNGVQPSCVTVTVQTPTLTKSFSPTTIASGGTTVLTFTITNPPANNPAQVVSYTDTLPSGLVIAATPGIVNNCSGGTVTAAAGTSTIAIAGVTVGASTASPTSCTIAVNVTNAPGQANPSCAGNPPNFTNAATNISGLVNLANGVQPSCVVVNTTTFSITKTASTGTVTPGSALSFTIVVTNNGPSAANGAIVTDPAIANYTVNAVSCTSTTGGATCPTPLTVAALQGAGLTIGTFPAGSSVTLVLDGTTSLSAGSLTNTVTVSPPASLPGVPPVTAIATVAAQIGVIPTLSVETLIALILLMAGLAGFAYRRKAEQR
jgi:hypothetical protein